MDLTEAAATAATYTGPALTLWVLLQVSKLRSELVERIHDTETRVKVLEIKSQ